MELKRDYDANNHARFTFKTNEGNFKIFYGSDLCLYWSCSILRDNAKDQYKYIITDENKSVYNIFNELYDSVVSKMPFKSFNTDDSDKYYQYSDNNLFKDGKIEWHSDDMEYNAASFLQIEKDTENNCFIVTFNRSKVLCDDIGVFSTYTVMISACECRYDPYNATFMEMYRKLEDYCNTRKHTFSGQSRLNKRRVRNR